MHACSLLKTLGQKLAGRYFKPKSGALPGHGGTPDAQRWKALGNGFPEPVSDLENDHVSGARQPQVWRHPYEAVGS